MSRIKELLDDLRPEEYYSQYADSEYWYNEWEKINRERVNNSDKIIINEKKAV